MDQNMMLLLLLLVYYLNAAQGHYFFGNECIYMKWCTKRQVELIQEELVSIDICIWYKIELGL